MKDNVVKDNVKKDNTYTLIFKLIKEYNFIKLKKVIETSQLYNLNIKDENNIYFIQYIINYNLINIFNKILEFKKKDKLKLNIDILDNDKRNILYNCIKYNYIKMLHAIIEYDKLNISLSILDIKDKDGLTALYYSIIFNNITIFKYLIESKSDIYIRTNDRSNGFHIISYYKRNEMMEYLINNKYSIDFKDKFNNNLLQISHNKLNFDVVKKIISKTTDINNQNNNYRYNILHMCIINNDLNLFKYIIDNTDININNFDIYGNNIIHLIINYSYINFLTYLIKNNKLSSFNFNSVNISGDTILHLLLRYNNVNDKKLIMNIIENTDINIQNNNNETCIMYIIFNNLFEEYKNILINKPLYIYNNPDLYTQVINSNLINDIAKSYYNQILILHNDRNKNIKLFDKNELSCINNDNDCIANLIKNITNNKKSFPDKGYKIKYVNDKYSNNILTNSFKNKNFYIGSTLDVLFGLIFLHNKFKKNKLLVLLKYPLLNVKNNIISDYTFEFDNIQITWKYQKLVIPSLIDDQFKNLDKNIRYIVIPIGIITSTIQHMNILFIDIEKKTIERFEPNGSIYPVENNYNPELLDNKLMNFCNNYYENFTYYTPVDFLPSISFQLYENDKTNEIYADGNNINNGFCLVWCIWWIYNRLSNIQINTKLENIAIELIKIIKLDEIDFDLLIKKFSINITTIRDKFLKKYNLTNEDWIKKSNILDLNLLDAMQIDIFKTYY